MCSWTKKVTVIFAGLIIFVASLVGCNRKDEQRESWTVTQYGDKDGNQMMCYTIEDKKGNLILIDGGYDTDADRVRALIEDHGNHVSAWIITHPHPDHAGAFNAVMAEKGNILADKIYTVEVHGERYRETARDYDRYDVYENFEDITSKMEEVCYLYENDELDVLGLHMKVLHTWNDETDKLDVNLCNNGSMMFVLTGNENSILFCSDVENETENYILERHREELNVDYVQTGHHGNWGLTTAFYDVMSPEAVFMDGPDWLINSTGESYDAYQLKAYFEKKGTKVYSFTTAPNQIVIY